MTAAPRDQPIRVLLVDDHDVFRHGLAQLLADEGLDVVAEASGGEAGVRLAAELTPDVVLMDLSMPGMDGIAATRAIAAAAAPGAPRVVALTLSDDDEAMLEALLAGAAGYVVKDATLEQIVAAVHTAAAGDAVIPPRVAPEVLRRLRAAAPAQRDGAPAVELSERELEVLRLIVDGRDNAAIAAELFISPNTVKSHVASIFAKLGVDSRLQASVQALRRGLVV
ncbi:MAG: response regulator transcription factor [Actinobacteria bacterium]|nr:response regulator transcription factor [Actinomycetota bacterium]